MAFAERHFLFLTWAQELTKHRRKAWHLCLHFVPVVLCSEPFSPAATLESGRTGMIANMFMTRE
jgi:hypothetical protein